MMIEDGKGSGRKAGVDEDNHLQVLAHTETIIALKNWEEGKCWSFPLDGLAPSGATKFFYILNTGTTNIGLAVIRIASSAAGVFRFTKVTGTAAGGTAVAAVPVNLESTLSPAATILSGTSITGLTDAGILYPMYVPANSIVSTELIARWLVPPGTAMAITAPGAAVVNGMILAYSSDAA